MKTLEEILKEFDEKFSHLAHGEGGYTLFRNIKLLISEAYNLALDNILSVIPEEKKNLMDKDIADISTDALNGFYTNSPDINFGIDIGYNKCRSQVVENIKKLKIER